MKPYEEMTLREVVEENIGNEILAIAKGEFRTQVFQSATNVLQWKQAQDARKAKKENVNATTKDEFTVGVNSCSCHPDSCCCYNWAIFKGGIKFVQMPDKEIAKEVVEALNK